MKQAKLINGLLWVVNILLIVGIAVYAWTYLLDSKAEDLVDLEEISNYDPYGGSKERPTNYSVIASVANPLTPKTKGGDPPPPVAAFQATLIGTFPPEFVFLKIGNDETLAEKGQKIMVKGAEVLRGWKLVQCTRESAIFSDGSRTQELKITVPSIGTGGPIAGAGGDSRGEKYDPSKFKTRKIHSSASREVWLMDPNEINWAMQNFQSEMEKNVTVSPTSNGLRITSINTGSIGISRGLKSNDVIRSVNGHAMKSLQDIKKMQDDPRNQRRRSMTIVVQRSGRNMVLEYRAQPSSGDR